MGRAVLVLGVVAILASGRAGGSLRLPRGGVLVYAQARPNEGLNYNQTLSPEHVYVARLDGTRPRLLGAGEQPSVSPDGRFVAFERGPLVLLDSLGGRGPVVLDTLRGRLPFLAGPPVWAPDSQHVAAIDGRSGELFLFDVGTRVTKDLAHADDFSFSPDSRRIVYEARGDLYLVSVAGGKPRRFTDEHKDFGPVWGKPGIAFNRSGFGTGDIWLANGNGTHIRQLTRTNAGIVPAFFSGDGTKLLAAIPPNHNGRLWAVNVRTGAARPLTPWVGDLNPQGLSRNGRAVLAAVGCGGIPSPYGYVETIPFAGGSPHVIVRGPCRASWDAG